MALRSVCLSVNAQVIGSGFNLTYPSNRTSRCVHLSAPTGVRYPLLVLLNQDGRLEPRQAYRGRELGLLWLRPGRRSQRIKRPRFPFCAPHVAVIFPSPISFQNRCWCDLEMAHLTHFLLLLTLLGRLPKTASKTDRRKSRWPCGNKQL